MRVNQLGYLPGRRVRATVLTSAATPRRYRLVDRSGSLLDSGSTIVWPRRPDPTTGLMVHRIDAGPCGPAARARFTVDEVGTSREFAIAEDLYDRPRDDALDVLTLLRSGAAVDDSQFPGYGRPAGHLGVPPNTGDTAVPAWKGAEADRLYPGWRCPGTFDVHGGWYDAGDYGKYVTSGGIAVWQLIAALDHLSIDTAGPLGRRMTAECRWQVDWLCRMQVPSGSALAGMAFHRVHGTTWSPVPGWPHLDPTTRVLHRPSTTATLHLAAVAAQAARVLAASAVDRERLLAVSESAYDAAQRHPDLLPPDDHARFGGGSYHDDDSSDDWYWAAAQLWLVTRDGRYLRDLEESPWHHADPEALLPEDGFDMHRVAGPAALDLALHGAGLLDHSRLRERVLAAAGRLVGLQQRQPWGQPYAPSDGWGWGSNGRLLNNLVTLVVASLVDPADQRFDDAIIEGIDYLFGRNGLGQSYVVGHGTDSSAHLRTRQFGHDLDPELPPAPAGALAGGANSQPSPDFPYDQRLIGRPPQLCYLDEPDSEVTNDLCIRWQAPLVYVTSHLTGAARSRSLER